MKGLVKINVLNHTPEWISTSDFAEKHGVNARDIYHLKKNNKDLFVEINGKFFIDEGYLLKAQEIKKELWNCATTLYYPVLDIFHDNESKMIECVSNMSEHKSKRHWRYFFNMFFSLPEERILDLWIQYKYIEFCSIGMNICLGRRGYGEKQGLHIR